MIRMVFVLYDGVVVVGGVGCVVLIPLVGVLLLWQSCAAGRGWGGAGILAQWLLRYQPGSTGGCSHHTLGDTLGCRQRDSDGGGWWWVVGVMCSVLCDGCEGVLSEMIGEHRDAGWLLGHQWSTRQSHQKSGTINLRLVHQPQKLHRAVKLKNCHH